MKTRTYTTADFAEELKNAQVETRKCFTAKLGKVIRFLFNETETENIYNLTPAMQSRIGLD